MSEPNVTPETQDPFEQIRAGARAILRQNYEDRIQELKQRYGLSEEDVQKLRVLPDELISKPLSKSGTSSEPILDIHQENQLSQSGEPSGVNLDTHWPDRPTSLN